MCPHIQPQQEICALWKKYKVVDRKTAPVQNSVYDKIYTEVTLEAVTEEESENICQTITERTDNLQDKFGY